MRVGVWGKGKTGGQVLDLLRRSGGEASIVFDSKNPPTLSGLQSCDALICFVPGQVFLDYIDVLKDAKIPVVTGATGVRWPSELDGELKRAKLTWVYASHFSIGMNLVLKMIDLMGDFHPEHTEVNYRIHEVHHTEKKDTPSGTALTWKKILDHPVEITSERLGDEIGRHRLTVTMNQEKIILEHRSFSRKIFAKGAIYAMEKILKNDLPYGFHDMKEIVL